MTDGATPEAGTDKYLDALRRFSSDLRMIRQVWQSMVDREVLVGRQHYELLLQAHFDGRDLAGAQGVIENMKAAGIEPDASVRWQLALATGRAGQPAQATAQLDALREEGSDPPDHLLPAVFSIEVAAGRLNVARAHLRRMAAKGMAARPAEYKALLSDVLDRRAIKDAISLFDAMLAAGQQPNPADVQSVLSMMARSGHPDRAEQLVQRLHDGGVQVAGDARTDIALGWARSGDVEHTREALRSVEEAGGGATSHHHNALLTAVLKSGDLQAAWDTATELAARAIPSGANLESLATLSLEKKRTALALGALDWMLMLGVPPSPNVLADVVGALLKDGKLRVATEVFFDCLARGVTADRRRARDVVEAHVRAGKVDRAMRLLEVFRAQGVLTNGRHYGTVLTSLARDGRVPDAVSLLRRMLADGVQPTVADASRLVGELVRHHQYDDARALLGTLAEAKITVDEPTYRELLWAYARKGQLEPAQAVHALMVSAGITPDDRHDKALQWASGETQRRLEDTDDKVEGGPPTPETPQQDDAPPATSAPVEPAPAPSDPARSEPAPAQSEPAPSDPAPAAAPQPPAPQPPAPETTAPPAGEPTEGAAPARPLRPPPSP